MINRSFCITILVLLSIGLYLPTLQYNFVYDDNFLIKENKWIKDIKHLPDIFLSSSWSFRENSKVNTYRPMQHVILMLEYFLFGLKAWGYHLVNILLHTGNTLLVFFLASFIFKTRQMTNDKKAGAQLSCGYFATVPAFFTALLFTAHPINTEAVAWITTVIELSMTSFYLLSFYLYVTSSPGWNIRFTGSVGLFALAVFSKEPALTLLFIILLYDYSKQNALSVIKEYRKYIPYLMVAAGYMALRLYALDGFTAENKVNMGAGELILNAFPLFLQYIQKLILPVDLKLLYVFHPVQSFMEWKVIGAMIFTLAFIFFMVIARTRDRVIFLGLSFIAIPLLPVFYLPAVRPDSLVFGERYLYLPSFGFALLVSYAFVKLSEALWKKDFDSNKTNPVRVSQGALDSAEKNILSPYFRMGYSNGVNRWIMIFSIMIVGGYSFAAIKRHAVWKNNLTLWSDTVKKSPDSASAHNNLGSTLFDRNKVDEAIKSYRIALKIDPVYAKANYNLGNALARMGRLEKAIKNYRMALKINPAYADAYYNLGITQARMGRLKKAIKSYRQSLKINPTFAKAHNNLGFALAKLGRLDEAIKNYRMALKIKPDFKTAINNLRKAQLLKKQEVSKVTPNSF